MGNYIGFSCLKMITIKWLLIHLSAIVTTLKVINEGLIINQSTMVLTQNLYV
jgi:hypothetical protein